MAEEDTQEAIKPTWSQKVGLWGYKLLCAVLRITPIKLVATLGKGIGYLVWAAIPSRRRIVARNLRIVVDPMLRPKKLRTMVRRNMVRTSMNLACSLKTGLMTDKEEAKSIRIIGADTFRQCGSNGHTAICCIPHAGNWEILARIRPHFNDVEHFGSMYRRMSNPLLEELVYRSRTAYGCEMFSKEDGLRAVLKLARTGGLLGVLSDQFTQEGLFLPYFGKSTGVTPLPALLYKRCKGKGHLISVFTRNTALGRWDAELGRLIELPEGCDSLEEITMQVNLALEKCQNENILDGFWMHHRWKCTAVFAPQDTLQRDLMVSHGKLPFRMLVEVPASFDEAIYTIPALRLLKASRPDAQITVLCPTAQQAFWQTMAPTVTYVCTTDATTDIAKQLDADEIYKDGPFDMLFMLGGNKKVYKKLKSILPVFTCAFDNSGLKKIRHRYASTHTGPPRNRALDYTQNMIKGHMLQKVEADLFCPTNGNAEATGNFIAPFSTLGAADSWQEEKWAQLVRKLGGATLLALPADEPAARDMATRLEIPCLICAPEAVQQHLGPQTKLYAVDGLLPQLAGAAGSQCTVIMASRLSERYGICLGEGHRYVSNHTPCHPCMQGKCDMPTPCSSEITVEQMLG